MSDTTKSTLPDSFAEAIEKKVEELANYHKLYGTHNGFDAVFRGIKELIPNLSSKEDVKKYACRSAAIAASTNEAYVEEALETFRKYGDAERASNLYLDVAWKRGSEQEKADYIASTAIPALSSYPDGEAKEAALGYHYFWLASHTLKTDNPDLDKVDELYRTALAYYSRVPCGDTMYANTVAARKFLPYFQKRPRMHTASITGEGWLIRDGKVDRPVRGATLIGKGAEVLKKIDRVGSNMWMAQGMCGASSGSIPTNVGQPMIRVTDMTVGGR